jgi:hypothetical protein
MFLRLFAMAVLFGGVAIGCDGPRYVPLDAAPSDAAAPLGTLSLVSPTSLTLRPAQTATIDVRYLDALGAPRAAATIAVAIEGTALDSTLGGLTVTTDASGLAHATLLAGMQATNFRVRLSAHDAAAPVYVDVGVGTSFGTLLVHAPYAGTRPVTHRVVDVVPGATCMALETTPPTSGGRTVRSATDDVTIAGLPTILTYAVLVRAEGDLATEAFGCRDGVMPVVDVTTTVTVDLSEVPLGIDGGYAVRATFGAGGTVSTRVAEWAYTLRATSEASGGDAAMLLDAIEAELVRHGATADAATLDARRATDPIDAALATQLTTDGTAPTETVASLLDLAGPALDAPTVTLSLTLGGIDTGAMTTQSLQCADGASGTVTLTPSTTTARTISTSTSLGPALAFVGPVDAPLGTLALAWMDAVVSARGHAGGVTELLAGTCASLETFAASTDGASALTACDATCRADACASVITQIMETTAAGAVSADHDVAGARILAMVAFRDDDGDARVDRLDGTISGNLVDQSGANVGPSDAISGTISGTRTPVP